MLTVCAGMVFHRQTDWQCDWASDNAITQVTSWPILTAQRLTADWPHQPTPASQRLCRHWDTRWTCNQSSDHITRNSLPESPLQVCVKLSKIPNFTWSKIKQKLKSGPQLLNSTLSYPSWNTKSNRFGPPPSKMCSGGREVSNDQNSKTLKFVKWTK